MPRANRYHVPGHSWHITHRCHQRDFLLQFARDRRRWVHWLFEARKRFDLTVLNYIVTSNHIHLLVHEGNDEGSIPRSMQLLAGRTGQEFNIRKKCRGAYREDRYHATAIEDGSHLRRCMTYINLNMVRASKVTHPRDWECSGYHEIKKAPLRYARIDRSLLAELVGLTSVDDLPDWQEAFIDEALSNKDQSRCPEWTESLAVGGEKFVSDLQENLGMKARYRKVEKGENSSHLLKEPGSSYSAGFGKTRTTRERSVSTT